jgi:predicted phosphodiesterase
MFRIQGFGLRWLVSAGVWGVVMAVGGTWAADQGGSGEFTFGVVADAQYCDAAPAGTRHYQQSPVKLRACVQALNEADPAFVIHLGDFIDRDFDSFSTIAPVYEQLQMPHYHVLGNHDFSVADAHKPEVPKRLGLTERYYTFRSHGWRFLVLDGNDLSLIARREGDPEYSRTRQMYEAAVKQGLPQAKTWNGALGGAQLNWLDAQLTAADTADEPVILFCHFPVFPPNAHNLWNDADVLHVLERHACVVAWMNGHNHAGSYDVRNGIHYVTFPGLVETADTTAYALVHVRPGQLEIQGFGRTPSRVLPRR